MKLKRLKRGLSALLAGLIAVSSVGITSVVFANAQSEILKYNFSSDGYVGLGLSNPLYVANANDLSNIENVTIPEVYDDGTNGSAMVAFASLSPYNTGVVNYSVKTVKVNTTLCRYSSIAGVDRPFRYLGALEKVEFAYSGKDFVLAEDLFRFTTPSKNDNETLKEVYINAESVVLYNSDVFRNRDSAITAKIYVKNENVKNTILEETAKGDYPVSADQIIVQNAAASLDYLKITEFTGNTTFDRCVDSLGPGAIYGKGSFAIYGYNPDMGVSIISNDDINTIQSMSTALKKISAEVEVSGSVDSPFTLAFEGCDSSITEDFDNAWYSSALGTEILDNKCTHTTASVTEAGTYTVEIMLENDAVFNGICNLDLHSLETGASTKNPNAEIKLKSVTFGEASEADLVDATNIFNYDIMDNVVFFLSFKDNYQEILNGVTEIKMPETITENGVTYNCSSQGLTMNFFENNYFTKVVFPNCYKETTMSIFQDCSSIKEISYEYESDDFCISMDSFKNCTSLKNLYMYAESITVDDFNAENAFFNVPTTAVAHVKNNTVKKSLEELMWPGSIIVDPSLGGGDTVNYTSLDAAIADGEAVDTTKYTEDSVKALTDAIAAAKAVEENAAATQDDVDAAAKAITDAIAALEEAPVEPVEIKWTGSFDRSSGLTTTDITGMTVKKGSGYMTFSGVDLSGMADPYVEVAFDANGSDDTLYVATSAWATVIGSSTDALAKASLADLKSTTSFIVTTNNKSGSFGKITSVRFCDAANDAPIDYTELDAAIADGEAVDTTKYTEDSAKVLTDAIASAKAVKENAAATQDDVDAAAKAIEDAVSALEIVWPITYDISAKHDGSVKAAVYIDGSLLISGSGATADYTGSGTNITPLANHEITSVKVEEGITDLGDWLFYDCTAITSITFPSTLKSIGAGCFSHTGFTSIEIPDSVTSVGSDAFSGCSSLVTVKLPSGLTTLNESTFYYCKSLTSVNIPDGVTSIGRGVFSSCTGLTSIDLPSGLTSIESFAFNGCGLTGDVVVPSGVVALKSQVFMNCTSSDLKIHLLGVIESYHNIGYASNPFEGVTGTIYVYNQASYDLLKKYVPATANLVFSNAYTDLETAINEADSKKEADYTSDSWEAFLTALANAKAVLAGGSSDFTAAKTDLTKAIEALVFADTSEIKESLAELVEKIELLLTLKDESNYTSESWTTLSKALEAAKTEETLTVSGYTALYNDLSNAYSGLTAVSTSDSEYLGTIYGGYEKTYNHETDSYKVVTSDDVDMNRVVGTTYVNVTCTPNDELKSQLPYGKLHIWNFLDGDQSYTKLNGSADNVFTYNLSIPSADSAFSLTAGTGWTSDKEVFYVKSVGFYNSDDELLYIYSVDAAGSEERSALKSAIEAAEKFDKNYYTEESVALLELMIEEANEMLNNVSATKADCSVRVSELDAAVKALVANVVTGTVTGTIKVSDENSETEMTVTAVAADGTKTIITASSMSTYTLENMPVGNYTLTVSGGKYAERSYKITVAEGDNALDVNLNPLGDVNGDGKITTADVGMANSHAKGVITLTYYDFVCANVNREGSITTADVGMINSHAKGVNPLW